MSTLSDRLAAAAKARGEVVAVRRPPVEETAVGPALEAEAADPRRIIVSATAPAVAVTPDRRATPDSVCPTCNRTGHLGVVDLPGRTADWTCDVCGTMWQVRLDDPVTSS